MTKDEFYEEMGKAMRTGETVTIYGYGCGYTPDYIDGVAVHFTNGHGFRVLSNVDGGLYVEHTYSDPSDLPGLE